MGPDKIKVVDGILDQIRDNGARFTKVDTETKRWYELNDVQAHQKIGHAIRDTIRLLQSKKRISTPNTTRSKVAKRQRQTNALKPQNHVLSTSGTRKKTMDDILKMSIETAEFLSDFWVESENLPPQSENLPPQPEKSEKHGEFQKEIPQPHSLSERTSSTGGFFLTDEYPEENFDYSPASLFGDFSNCNARPMRITSE